MSAPAPTLAATLPPGRLQPIESFVLVGLSDFEEVQHGTGGQGNAVIGPRQKLQVEDATSQERRVGVGVVEIRPQMSQQELCHHVIAEGFSFLFTDAYCKENRSKMTAQYSESGTPSCTVREAD